VFAQIPEGQKIVRCEEAGLLPDADTDRVLTTPGHLAYIKIAEGCNRKCTYCIIPTLRGELKSRTVEDIVTETEKLVKAGVKELNILAQESTEYGHDLYGTPSLALLLKKLVKIPKIEWIRLYYLYPGSFNDELLALMKHEAKICNYFDFPIQHISDRLLQKMGRQTTGKEIREKLSKIRQEIPDAVFRTSVIVGFPSETEEEYQELKQFLREFQFDYVGIFPYSREEGTPAYHMADQISEEIKEKRQAELANQQRKIANCKNKKRIQQKVAVMVDGVSSEDRHLLEGRMTTQAWDIDGKVFINDEMTVKSGEIVTVILEQNFDYDYIGSISVP
jgi:ribosomal protein S12 methylthiotransferase